MTKAQAEETAHEAMLAVTPYGQDTDQEYTAEHNGTQWLAILRREDLMQANCQQIDQFVRERSLHYTIKPGPLGIDIVFYSGV